MSTYPDSLDEVTRDASDHLGIDGLQEKSNAIRLRVSDKNGRRNFTIDPQQDTHYCLRGKELKGWNLYEYTACIRIAKKNKGPELCR